ncbi:alpha-2-macroglobulin family protein [Taibaiella koreensis]|uniref:alpha-2-macroglobulin family protein n=1 Tax=Taibaiella koreensis TaxID=1268548 RepID=UPI0013C2DA65|nr:carboxypeptidase-like regulatory domain-containing protein [Taibaiella koreensis]
MKASLISLALLLGYCFATAQPISIATPKPGPDYLYRITSAEALYLLEHPLKTGDTTFFHDLVGQVPKYSDSLPLPYGHYLQVYAEGNTLRYRYIASEPWLIYIPEDGDDLLIQLTSRATRQPVTTAVITLKGKPIPYDLRTAAYKHGKTKRKGLLAVSFKGETYYYTVKRERNKSEDWRWSDKPPAKTTIQYLATPVRAIAGLFARKRKEDRDQEWEMQRRFGSYFFFSKPIYRPGDTIRFKAQVLNKRKNKWLDKALWVTLNDENDHSYYLGKVKPAAPGEGYSFQFVIQDSMNIRLDRDHKIELKNKDSATIAWGRFAYEEYELKRCAFKAELMEEGKQVRGKPFRLKLTAKDANELPVPDAQAELFLIAERVTGIEQDTLLLPDTFWHYQTAIENGEKIVAIPDSIFPNANISYNLYAVMQNSEHERTVEQHWVNFMDQEINIDLLDDSVMFSCPEKSPDHKMRVSAFDRSDNLLLDTAIYLPCVLPLNPHAYEYSCGETFLETEKEEDGLDLDWYQVADSFLVTLHNPRKLPAIYHLYEGNKEIARGYGQTLSVQLPVKRNIAYKWIISYIWSGRMLSKSRYIGLASSLVNLEVAQPAVVYPGKETEITITATDAEHKPAAGMDILAYAYTRRFDHEDHIREPYLPYLGPYLKEREPLSRFSLEEVENYPRTGGLSFPFWHSRWGLDTGAYYQLLYPAPGVIPRFHLPSADSITQVAPFIVQSGKLLPVLYVLIDNIPVYYGFTDDKLPYSFETDTNAHQITVRTSRHLITIPQFRARPFVRNVFSIDVDAKAPALTITDYPDTLTINERSVLSPFVMGYDPRNGYFTNACLSNGASHSAIRLTNSYSARTVGPLVWKYWIFKQAGRFAVNFEFEPFSLYNFAPGLVKQKELSRVKAIPPRINAPVPQLNDEVLTEEQLEKDYRRELLRKRRRDPIKLTGEQSVGKATITLDLDTSFRQPLNLILIKPGDFSFIRVYPGETTLMNKLPEGIYELIVVSSHNVYLKSGKLLARNNYTNFYRFRRLDTLSGKYTVKMDSLLSDIYEQPEGRIIPGVDEVLNTYIRATYNGPSMQIEGTLIDSLGEPVPGASITVATTAIGTVSDADGHFQLAIPEAIKNPRLVIKALGCETKEIAATPQMFAITLEESRSQSIGEVQVYGQKVDKRSYTGAVSIITSTGAYPLSSLLNTVNSLSGQAMGIGITYSNTSPQLELKPDEAHAPLIVIDGLIFSGPLGLIDLSAIASITLVKDKATTSLYGARAANGVLQITIRKGATLPEKIRKGLEQPPAAMPETLMASGLRHRFRDDAYWYPHLKTDKQGKVSFKVIYPDDITAWKTFVFATDGGRRTGSHTGLVKSYKPLSASLYAPSFLVKGDTAFILGKSVSYLPDTQQITGSFFLQDQLVGRQPIALNRFHNHIQQVIAPAMDSVRLKYQIARDEGYFDGEQTKLPVIPIGVSIARGRFTALRAGDTTFTIRCQPHDTTYLTANASLLDIVREEIGFIQDYPYLCNEQLASKIIAALQQQHIMEALGQKWAKRDQKKVQDMIALLLQRQNGDKLWGWWENGATIQWVSQHVLQALVTAKERGYTLEQDAIEKWVQPIQYIWERDSTYRDIHSLQLMYQAGLKVNYEKYVSRIERQKQLQVSLRLELIRLRQQLGLPYAIQPLLASMQSDLLGNIFWQDSSRTVFGNEVMATTTALKILLSDSTIAIDHNKVIGWLLQQRSARGWRNTYESAQIIEALAPALNLSDSAALKPRLRFSGNIEEAVTTFPYRKTIYGPAEIVVEKKGRIPAYLSWYCNYWDTSGKNDGKHFVLSTTFRQEAKVVSQLSAGVPVTMMVDVTAIKAADFVQIDIPIPAGCTFEQKSGYYPGETHREYHKDRVSIFCEIMAKGHHTFTVDLLPKFDGTYTCNPAKAELMYFPVFYGCTPPKKISIR